MSVLQCFQGEHPEVWQDQEGRNEDGKVMCTQAADLKLAACVEATGAQIVMAIVSVVTS